MPILTAAAPVLPVTGLDTAVSHYRLLGFEVAVYGGAEPYAFGERGGVQLHLAEVPGIDPDASTVSVYLYVDDADALYSEWSASGAAGRHIEPRDTDYGLREGAHVDPDGNLLRYGSPIKDGTAGGER